jgi:hypothetical protein
MSSGQGPKLLFFKYFRQENSAKNMAFFTQNKAKLCKHYENIGF